MSFAKIVITVLAFIAMNATNVFAIAQKSETEYIRLVFKETKKLCSIDNGLLWGHSLDVPIMFVDAKNSLIYTNKNSHKLNLTEDNGIYTGSLPDFIEPVKGTQFIGKRNWAVIPLPLPKNKIDRMCLIIHEAFHCLQPALDLNPTPYNNNHMDEMAARIWLKLEWKALEKALHSEGNIRKQAIIDAICFRKYRRTLFSNCDGCENRFEIHEGMAEYTANKICRTDSDFKFYLQNKLDELWQKESYADSFAYFTAPVYAYLLDQSDLEWRNHLGSKDDISILVQAAYNIALPFDLYMEAEERAFLYGSAKIMVEEIDRKVAL